MFIYGVGASIVSVKILKYRDWFRIPCLLAPLFALLVFWNNVLGSIGGVLAWPSKRSDIFGLAEFSAFEFAKLCFKTFRPSFELVSTAQDNLFMAVFFPALFAAMLLITMLCFIWRIKYQTAGSWLVTALSFHWILLAPTGHSTVTRALLPCLFFMPVFLIMRIPKLPRLIYRINVAVLISLIFINIYQALYPTLRFYSAVPFQKIARDSIRFAVKKNIDSIYISGNTLNAQAIRYYMEKEIQAESPTITVIPPNYKTKPDADRSVFISHLPENGSFIYYQRLFPEDSHPVENINNYLRIDALPYNRLWKKQILERGDQPYAVMVYYVNKK